MSLRLQQLSCYSKIPILSVALRSSSSWSDSKYQHLQDSKIPTMHFQKSLPRLPIPPLAKTCSRYLRSLEPIVTAAELEKTKALVKDFEEGRGKGLNEQLLQHDANNKHTSYICEPWFDMYLSSRSPVVLNYNPFLAWRRDPQEEYNDQLVRSANLIVSSLRFYNSMRKNILEPMVYHLNPAKSDSPFYRDCMRFFPESLSWYGSFLFKAYPLDMSQFKNLFQTSRIPKANKDTLLYDPTSRHMTVLYKGNFYAFDVIDDKGDIISPQAVFSNLKSIINRNDPPAKVPLGSLTTMNRDEWAEVRDNIESDGNASSLHTIDTSLMMLVLDDEEFQVEGDIRLDLAHHFLHGPGHNRWFDKSFQIIVTKCGNACVNFEHSWGDGVAVLRYFNDVHKDSTENHYCHPDSGIKANLVTAEKIEFEISESVQSAVKKATAEYNVTRHNLSLSTVEHEGVTKEFIKQQKLSPDAIFQLSFQLGFYKQQGFTPVTYESCSTSAFRHGRTEVVRPATMQTKKCVEAICSGNTSPEEIRTFIDEASRMHNLLTKEAALGQGFDRHLFALKNTAIRNGEDLHDIFTDPTFMKNNNFTLSTSTLHGEAFIAGGFAPVVKDGYGLGYGMPEKNFGVLISSYKTHTDGEGLAKCLKDGLDQIVEILEKCKLPVSK